MNAEVKKQWVEALRSGEYKQTQGHLRKDGQYCCLGVLCDLHAKATGGQWEEDHYGNCSAWLPRTVCSWAGLSLALVDSYVVVNRDDGCVTLATLNDNGKTFNDIAHVIEEYL